MTFARTTNLYMREAFFKHRLIIGISLGLILLYLFVRTQNLLYIPLFGDEADYLYFAHVSFSDPMNRMASLEIGKQPLYFWLVMAHFLLMKDSVLAGRLVSIEAGLVTMIFVTLLSYTLFHNKKIALLTVLLFIFNPFTHVYNRLAVLDSLVGMFYVMCLYLSVLLVRYIRLDVAYTLALAVFGGVLTKTPAYFSLYMLPTSLILFDFGQNQWIRKLAKWVVLLTIPFIFAYFADMLMRISPFYERILWFNGGFTYPKREILKLGVWLTLQNFFINAREFFVHSAQYFTAPLVFCFFASVFFIRQHLKPYSFLLVNLLIPLVIVLTLARWPSTRWAFFLVPLCIPFVAFGMVHVFGFAKKYVRSPRFSQFEIPFYILLMLVPAYITLSYSIDPVRAAIPEKEREQYVLCTGWGVRNAVPFFEARARQNPLYIATVGELGVVNMLRTYLWGNPNVQVKGYTVPYNSVPEEVLSSKKETYYVRIGSINSELRSSKLEKVTENTYFIDSKCKFTIYRVEN